MGLSAPETLDAYRVMIEAAGDAILVADFSSARFVDANSRALSMFGYNRAELAAMTGRDLSAAPAEEHARHSARLRDTGQLEVKLLPLRRKDGAVFYADLWVKKYEIDGRPYHVNIVRDTTTRLERERLLSTARAELVASEATYRGLVDCMDDAVFIFDWESARVIEANPAAVELFGYGKEDWPELVGRKLHPPSVSTTIDRIAAELRGTGRAERQSLPAVTKHGREILCDLRLRIYDAAGRKLYVAVLRDVTERERRRRLLERSVEDLKQAQAKLMHVQRLAAVGEMAAAVAHEINNPAAYVALNLAHVAEELARLAPADPGVDELLAATQSAVEGVERIRSVTRDLRTFARVEHSDVRWVELNELVRTAARMTDNELRHRARLELELGPLPKLLGDPGKLSQVVINLLVNAAQAIEEGHAEHNVVRVTTRELEEAVELAVQDSGCGMSDEVRRRAFEPFFTTKPKDLGTGLGLSLCADIVRRHGGDIEARPAEPRGTRVVVTIPRDTGLASSEPPPSEEVEVAPADSARLLIIDDEPSLLRAYQRLLRGCDVVTAEGGREALLVLAHDQRFDLIVCDLMMPEVDGPMVYERICDEHPELAARLVFSSGGAFTQRVRELVARSGVEVLEKPVERDTLLGLVARLGRP